MEVAIVLVIMGLLLGSLLKGQELLTNARVRELIGQQDGIKAAFFGFQDRSGFPGRLQPSNRRRHWRHSERQRQCPNRKRCHAK